jgi:hypothetical protein
MKLKFLEPPSKSFLAYLKRQDAILAQAKRDADRAEADIIKLMRSLPPGQRATMSKLFRTVAHALRTGKKASR